MVNIEIVVKQQKILCIPILLHQNKYVTDFKRGQNYLTAFFAKQYSTINNPSEIPFNLSQKTDVATDITSDDIATLKLH